MNIQSRTSRLVLNGMAWGLAILVLWLVLRRMDSAELKSVTVAVNPWWLLPAAAMTLFSELLISPLRYQALLGALGWRLPLWDVVSMRMCTIPVKQIAPFKTGEATWIIWLRAAYHIPVGTSLLTFLLNAFAQLFSLTAFAVFGLLSADPVVGGILAAAVVAGTLVMLRLPSVLIWLAEHLPKTAATAVSEIAGRVRTPVFQRKMVDVFALSLLCTALNLATAFCVLSAFGLRNPGWPFFPVMAALILVTDLPLTPFGLGIREAFLTLLAAEWMTTDALACSGLMLTGVSRLLPALVGLFWLIPFISRGLAGRGLAADATGERTIKPEAPKIQ